MSNEFKESIKQDKTFITVKIKECVDKNESNDLKWLIEEYKLAAKDLRADDNCAIRCASENGHDKVVELLMTKLTVEDLRAWDNYAIRCASENGHDKVVELLMTKLTAKDLRAGGNYAIRRASENGHYKVVELLMTKLTVKEDITKGMYDDIIRNNKIKILQILIDNGLNEDFDFVNKIDVNQCTICINNLFKNEEKDEQEFEIIEKNTINKDISDKDISDEDIVIEMLKLAKQYKGKIELKFVL